MAARTLALRGGAAEDERPRWRSCPGVTAALAAGALLGAPLADDWAVLSLSDLHVPWATVERRLAALAAAGLALALYNPRSRDAHRASSTRALEVLREHRDGDTPVGRGDRRRRGRARRVERATLATVDPERVTDAHARARGRARAARERGARGCVAERGGGEAPA